ncbi:MAG: sigma-70 family RNA polymerase sigma factor [Bacteroidales bacterium]|nr:sigma-70 family RNA polymerase sigma factor [Bacteroidales bacterium]
MEVEKLEELLLSISYKEENIKNAESAFNILYKEYSKLLYSVLKNNFGIRDKQFLNAIVNNTFLAIYENPLFTTPDNSQKNTDNAFKGWILQIAKNELQDLLQDFKILNIKTSDNNEPVFIETYIDAEKDNINIESINAKILKNALDSLPERDRDVLRFLYLYQEDGKKTPSKVLNNLCNYFGITKENIRQIKVRSEKKIIEYFSKYSQLKSIKYAKG